MKQRWLRVLISFLVLVGVITACAQPTASPTPLPPGPVSSPVSPQATTPAVQPYPVAPTMTATSPGPASAQPSAYPALPLALTPGAAYGKEGKVIGNAFVEEAGARYDTTAGRLIITVAGYLPTPCHTLQTQVTPPDDQKNIRVQVFSLVDPNQICTQVTHPYETNLPLDKLPSGTYKVWVNDKALGDVVVP